MTDKHSMLKTKELFFEQYYQDIESDSKIDWELVFFKLIDALREDFDYVEDEDV